jgi:hypothetical protein
VTSAAKVSALSAPVLIDERQCRVAARLQPNGGRNTARAAPLEKALASTGADPIQRLERQIASAKRKGDRTEVLEGLKQFLESPRKRNDRKALA